MAKRTTEVTVQTASNQLPVDAEMDEFLQQYSGAGVSTRPEDTLIPIIYLMQDGSPQVKPRDPKYIDGAQAGDFLLTSTGEVLKGEEGFWFQPVMFVSDWGQWVPRDKGGGFRGRHRELPAEAVSQKDPKNPNFLRYFMPSGDELIPTRNHYGYLLREGLSPQQALIALTSTGHQVSRNWMTIMGTKRTPSGALMPSFSHAYQILSKVRKNPGNPDSMTWAIGESRLLSLSEMRFGAQLHDDIKSGAKVAENPDSGGAEMGHTSDDNIPF